jgi:hypothetical protein
MRNAPRRNQSALPGVALVLAFAGMLAAPDALADESGVSFWLPGQYGSFAAVAPEPGFSLPTVSYYYTGSMNGSRTLNGIDLAAGAETDFFGQFIVPTYTPDTTFLGARPNFSLVVLPSYNRTSADVSIGPLSASRTDSVTGFGDIYPTAQLFWNEGVNNWMAYVTGNIPVGNYDSSRLANLGIGHAAIDAGGAYTYLNPNTGWEFSATAGVTFNFENEDTDYTNGIDAHLDLGLAKFLTEQLFVGAVGFAYQQLTPDEGQPAVFGDFKSRVFGIGPQAGYNFIAGGVPVYTNLRGYLEFGAKNRPEGGSMFLTVNLPVSAWTKANAGQ